MANTNSGLPDASDERHLGVEAPGGEQESLLPLAEQYGGLRYRLIYFFRRNRSSDPDMLADVTLYRVMQKLLAGVAIDGSLEGYCRGVARHVLQESWRQPEWVEIPPAHPASKEPGFANLNSAERAILLEQCMRSLSAEELEIWRRYYLENRHAMALELNISENALRIKVHRINKTMIEAGRRTLGPGL
jgi:DNA-directed RNA polymerase specialized sigma24 family protein